MDKVYWFNIIKNPLIVEFNNNTWLKYNKIILFSVTNVFICKYGNQQVKFYSLHINLNNSLYIYLIQAPFVYSKTYGKDNNRFAIDTAFI